MNLATCRSAMQRNDFVMRLGAVMVSLALAVSLVIQPPKAKAFAVVGELYTVVSSFMASCGLSWGVQGMDETGFGEQVARLLQDYLDTEFAGQTPLEWAGDIAVMATPQGKLQIPKMLVEKLAAFANWTIEKLGITAGESVVIYDDSSFIVDGYTISYFPSEPIESEISYWYSIPISVDEFFPFSGLSAIRFYSSRSYFYSNLAGSTLNVSWDGIAVDASFGYNSDYFYILLKSGRFFTVHSRDLHADNSLVVELSNWLAQYTDVVSSVSIEAATAIDVPDASTMADDEALEIGVGAAAGVALDVLLKQILDAILAGNLTATREITKAEDVTKPGEITDVDGLGLPALGAALTSRFPFSIPWDVFKGVQLLAAPPKTPCFEVDFFAPISGLVGGWKGSTKLVLDFSEYEIIGQVSRWASTIGFCLMLASGTKKLIWTA